jgi:hypothetical protein
MNYCSLQEAWGQGNYISKEYKKYDQKIDNIRNFQKPNIEKPIVKKKSIENFSKVSKNEIHCNEFIDHLKNCRSCQIKIRQQFRPKILENIEDIIQTNRDIIVLVLVGICIMLFFNLITSTVK